MGMSVPSMAVANNISRKVKLHQVISSPTFAFCTLPDFGRWKRKLKVGVVGSEERDVRQKPSYRDSLFLVKEVDVDGYGAVVILKQLSGRQYDPRGDEVVFHVKAWEYPPHVTIHGVMHQVEHFDWMKP